MESAEVQRIIDDLDFIKVFVAPGDGMPEREQLRQSLDRASDILTWLPDETVEQIPHFNLIRRD